MTEVRTVTVHTRDHGPVTVPEPAWCVEDHAAQHGGFRADIVHYGPETAMTFRGFELLHVGLAAYPHSEIRGHGPHMTVDLGPDHVSLDPAGLDELAAALVEHARTLRHHARELSALLGSEGDR